MTFHAALAIFLAVLSIFSAVLLIKALACALFVLAIWEVFLLIWSLRPIKTGGWCCTISGSRGRLMVAWMEV